jgi:hypothetical protein
MPRFRYVIDRPDKVYQALVVAADVARESPVAFDLGPWDDQELRASGVIEVVGSDEAANLVVARWIDAGVGFEEI